MRPFKSLIIIFTITLVALFYVHTQVELVKLSYALNYKEKMLKEMLDRRGSLEYNIDNLENPARLEGILISRNIEVSFPKKGQVFRVAKASQKAKRTQALRTASIERKSFAFGFLEFFGLRAEAQARER